MKTIGFVKNARFGKHLIAEGWFDIAKTRTVEPRILAALKREDPIELSTGLFTDNHPHQGYHRGRRFDFIARNYRPDHLAILIGRRGACSLDDGCGVLANTDFFTRRLTQERNDQMRTYDDDLLVMPTINWEEEANQRRKKKGCQCQCSHSRAQAEPAHDDDHDDDDDLLISPPLFPNRR